MSRKAWMFSKIFSAGIEKIPLEILLLRSILEAIRFEFKMKGPLVAVEICVLCGWRFQVGLI